ncbi:MAG: hypothetical protein ACC645_01055 [Pirellulales bacterium]
MRERQVITKWDLRAFDTIGYDLADNDGVPAGVEDGAPNNGDGNNDGTWNWSFDTKDGPDQSQTVTITARDNHGSETSTTFDVMVRNVAPTMVSIDTNAEACSDVGEQEAVSVMMRWSDPGLLDTFTARIQWGDGNEDTRTYSAGTRSLSESHAYQHGGVYQISVTLTDDDTGQAVATTTAYITGVGIVGDRLYVVGTNSADQVIVNPAAKGGLRVHASFLPERQRTLSANGVREIVVLLCDGDDRASVAGSIRLATQIHGGGGNDRLNGGGGLNVLLGGLGDDRLIGGRDHDLMIGGDGADKLNSNNGGDVIVSGGTVYDGVSLAQMDRLFAIIEDYADDGELDPENRLDETTVFDDDFVDEILGASSFDLLFYELGVDRVRGKLRS